MNDYTVGVQRPATPYDIEVRADKAIESVQEGNEDALLAFTEHLIEEGILGMGIEEMSLGLTVKQLVTEYAATRDGKAEVKAWAYGLAEEQCEEGIAA